MRVNVRYGLEINWLRCPDGYQIVPVGEIVVGDKWASTGSGVSSRLLSDLVIAPKSGRRETCHPIRKETDRLYLTFANLQPHNPASLIGFANQYGLLGLDPEGWSDPAKAAYELIEGPASGWQEDGGRDSWQSAIKRMFVEISALSDGMMPYTLPDDDEPLGMMKGVLRRTEAGLALAFRPVTLLDALRLQFGMRAAQGVTITQCAQCGTPFEIGAAGRKRIDAKFCSPTCRHTFRNRRLSQGEGK